MDRTQLKEALEKARLVIASHGMIAHMPSYYKSALMTPVANTSDRLSYEFYLDPNKSGYAADNYNCALNVYYQSSSDIERDGGIYRDFTSKISIRLGSSEITVDALSARENMIASLAMLAQVVEATIPKMITVTVMTPEDLKEKKRLEYEQKTARRIFDVVGKNSTKNLRTGGKPRISRIPEKYAEEYGSMPEVGRYRFDQIRRVDRSGRIVDRAGYLFVVSKMYDDSYVLRAARTS